VVRVEGPWTHRDVGANGQKFHVAEIGHGPLVLLLHGFPQFWWSWRFQLEDLAARGFRVVAPDLRGYGGSDKPPRGYDGPTLAADVAGLIRALGERDAVVVGQDWGGFLGWTIGALHPQVVRRLIIVSMPHPLAFRAAWLRAGPQLAASTYMLRFQLPWKPERDLVADDAQLVADLLRAWGGEQFPLAGTVARYREQMQVPGVAHSALEYYRWILRSQPRPDGLRFAREMARPLQAPTLQIQGLLDPCTLPSTARGSRRYVAGRYALIELPGVGHFPAEEAPAQVTEHIAAWAAG
jgi:pimeloyl-ACP methyl ester carboxylesterase